MVVDQGFESDTKFHMKLFEGRSVIQPKASLDRRD